MPPLAGRCERGRTLHHRQAERLHAVAEDVQVLALDRRERGLDVDALGDVRRHDVDERELGGAEAVLALPQRVVGVERDDLERAVGPLPIGAGDAEQHLVDERRVGQPERLARSGLRGGSRPGRRSAGSAALTRGDDRDHLEHLVGRRTARAVIAADRLGREATVLPAGADGDAELDRVGEPMVGCTIRSPISVPSASRIASCAPDSTGSCWPNAISRSACSAVYGSVQPWNADHRRVVADARRSAAASAAVNRSIDSRRVW